MFYYLVKEIKSRFIYVFFCFIFNFTIIYVNKKQFFYFLLKPLYFSNPIFNWSFSFASPIEIFFSFIFVCFFFGFFFSIPVFFLHVFFFFLPSFSKINQCYFIFIAVFSFFLYFFSFFFVFFFILPSFYSFCFEQNTFDVLFSLHFFPIVFPYVSFCTNSLFSFFFFFQFFVFFLVFFIKNQSVFPFFIRYRKYFFISCFFFGTVISTPEISNQLFLSFFFIFFFESVVCFFFIFFCSKYLNKKEG